MKYNLFGILCALGLTGKTLAFPATVNEFYEELHTRLTPRPSDNVDACQKIAKKPVISYQDAIDCYNSFPLDDKVRQETLDSIKKTLELYAYKDIMSRSPERMIPSNKDIDNEMDQIANYEFSSEFEFNSFLMGYFKSYHDGHTDYQSICYSMFTFRQPFPIFIVDKEIKTLNNSVFSVEFVKEWLNLGVDITKYQGSEVLKINGMNPLKYLKAYSNFYVGQSRDINSRLNLIFARLLLKNGNLGFNHGSFAYTNLVPISSSVTYSLKTSENKIVELEVPYLVQSPGNFQDSSSYYKKYCNPFNEESTKPEEKKQEAPIVKNAPVHQSLIQSRRSKRDVTIENLINTSSLQAYLIEGNVGVLVIPSFEPEGDNWYNGIYLAFKSFKNRKVKKLILELSNNGGGRVCRGYDILFGLFPNSNLLLNDMRSSPLQIELSKSKSLTNYSPLSYDKPNGKTFNRHEAFTNKRVHPRGNNQHAEFTPKFKVSCPQIKNPFPITFKPENIAVVTNTICYSTCSQLVNSLQELHNVTTYAVGGDPALPTPPASMAGGVVMEFNDLISTLKGTNLLMNPSSPKPLPVHVSFRFLRNEVYSHKRPNRPLEFTFLPARHHLSYTDLSITHPAHIWSQIAKQMKKSKSQKPSSEKTGNDGQGVTGGEKNERKSKIE